MDALHITAVLITLAAAFTYINHRFIKMPMSIGLMLMSLLTALVILLADSTGYSLAHRANQLVTGIDFNKVLMEGMLGMLLFAGAIHINLNDLAHQKVEVALFATLGVVTNTLLVGAAAYGLTMMIGLNLRPIDCILFGALISPTDPIAVLNILKRAGAPKSLELKLAGESLFNDGIGVVVFLVILELATSGQAMHAGQIIPLLTKELAGGLIFGLIAGYIAYRLLKSINNYQVEIIITLALVMGGYTLASDLHLSAPIAMVIAGLMIGNHGRRFAMSDITRDNLDMFWELIDEMLNAVLFILIGLEVLVLALEGKYLLAGAMAIPVVLLSRLISIGVPVIILKRWRPFAPRAIRIMTWGGLRGGISVALALSLPETCHRELLLTMTYVVVIFSILVQGLTIKYLVKD